MLLSQLQSQQLQSVIIIATQGQLGLVFKSYCRILHVKNVGQFTFSKGRCEENTQFYTVTLSTVSYTGTTGAVVCVLCECVSLEILLISYSWLFSML